jgi:hypothetical protein
MKHLDLESYRRVNESFHRRLVCRIGVDCGFFVEMNYMVNAMLYCLANRIQFQLFSRDANFGTGIGWTEYFQPFCKEVYELYHLKYNLHQPPTWKRILKKRSLNMIVWKLKSIIKTLIGRIIGLWIYKEIVLLNQDVVSVAKHHFVIPELDIDGDYTEVYGLIVRMIWRLRPEIIRQELELKKEISLPDSYFGAHIRGGDKAIEAHLISGKEILTALSPKEGDNVFVLIDNYQQLEMIRSEFPHLRILSLCQTYEKGYFHQEFIRLAPQQKKESIVRLIISVDILLNSQAFVGTITSGPSVFVMKVRANESSAFAIDCPKEKFVDSLSLNSEERAAISYASISRRSSVNQ